MTLTEQLQAVLDPLVAGGSWYATNTLELNADTVYPFVTFIKTVSTQNNTLNGPTDIQNTRVQIDLYATTVASLEASSAAVAAAMQTAFAQSIQVSSQDRYEDVVRLYRRSFDYSIWSTN